MRDTDSLVKVGQYNTNLNKVIDKKIKALDIYMSRGLIAHMMKRKHYKCLKYIDCISDIIKEPDYIGVNPNEKGESIELIKRYSDNVLIGIKLDETGEYLYISTMHDIQESKIKRRLYSGRIRKNNIDNQKE